MRPAVALSVLGIAILLASIVLVGTTSAETTATPKYNTTYNTSAWQRTYNYYVNITKSATHEPKYITPFNRPGNFSFNWSKRPKEELGVKPVLKKPEDLHLDVKAQSAPTRLDPRTCPNDLAYCYQLLEHEQNRTTFGRNYTAVSSYILPEKRIRQYVCVGDDTACVESSTNCFCPTEQVNPPPLLRTTGRTCTDQSNLCLSSFGTFVLCEGNLTSCQEKYQACGCGPSAACVSSKQTCVNTRNQLVLCKGAIADCIKEFGTCFCGPEMFLLQNGCTTKRHECTLRGEKRICYGSLAQCAVKYDKCDC